MLLYVIKTNESHSTRVRGLKLSARIGGNRVSNEQAIAKLSAIYGHVEPVD